MICVVAGNRKRIRIGRNYGDPQNKSQDSEWIPLPNSASELTNSLGLKVLTAFELNST